MKYKFLFSVIILFFTFNMASIAIEKMPDAFNYSTVIEQLDKKINDDIELTNSDGSKVMFSSYLGDKPILINFAYFTCPKLCHLVVSGMADALSKLSPRLLNNIQILTISFDHRDTLESASLFKNRYFDQVQKVTKEPIQWDFLLADPDSIKSFAAEMGYNFFFNSKSNQYSHPSVLIFLTNQSIVSRYLYGIMFNPFDVKMTILESKRNKSISTVDNMLLFCYNYDPTEKGYVLEAINLMKIAGSFTVLSLFGFIGYLKINEKNG